MEQIVIFQIGPEYLGIKAVKVHQISEPIEAVRIPNIPDYILGIINFRGTVIPLIDLKRRLEVEPTTNQKEQMMIIAEEEGRKAGLIVDRVIGLKQIPVESLEVHPQLIATKFEKEFFQGIARLPEYPVFLLDLKKIMTK